MMYAEIIIPLPIKDTFTFSVSSDHVHLLKVGHRVEVQFGAKKKYAGIVYSIHELSLIHISEPTRPY